MDDAPRQFRLNEFDVDVDACRIRSADGEVRVPLRLMRLLRMLAERPGETLRREELVEQLWPRGYVNEEALSRAVAELRGLLGDNARNPRFIETIPKRGYRLVADVQEMGSDGAEMRQKPRGTWSRPWVWALGTVLLIALWVNFSKTEPPAPLFDGDPLSTGQRLTADPGVEFHPEISPNGQWLAYTTGRNDQAVLVLASPGNSDDRREATHPEGLWSPAFDPSGNLLAAAAGTGACQVMLIPVLGGQQEPLTSCWNSTESPLLDWSPDGDWLAFVDLDRRTGSSSIWRLRLSDGLREQLTFPEDSYVYDSRPRFSPDGRLLSFARGTRAAREIYLLELEASTRTPQQLTFDHQFTVSHDWLPSGDAIVLDSDRTGHRALWQLDLEGNLSLLGARDAQSPSVADDGSLAFQVSQYEANIYAMDIETGEASPEPLIASTKYDSSPAWSPDGSEIAFASNRTGRGSIWVANSDGTRTRSVYEPESGRALVHDWSPDGSELIGTEYSGGAQRIIRIALDRRDVRTVNVAGERPYGAFYSEDGEWIFYNASSPGGGVKLWRVAADGSTDPEPWSEDPINRALAPGDGWLYYSLHDMDGLWQAPVDDPGAAERTQTPLRSFNWDDWTVLDRWVYHPTDFGLGRTSAEHGETLFVSEIRPVGLGPTLVPSPDGRTMLVVRTDRAVSDLFVARPPDQE